MNVPIWVLLIVQLVALSLGVSSAANQPDGDQVSAPVELGRIADDSSDAGFVEPVESMETDATYHRRYYYPRYYQRYPTYNYNTRRYYNTNYQYNRRPYYYNRYPQSNNYVSRPSYSPAPVYRPAPTSSPETEKYNNLGSSDRLVLVNGVYRDKYNTVDDVNVTYIISGP